MTIAITHAKINNIPDWTQAELDAQIALGNFPPGTVLADIILPSDWNAGLSTSMATGKLLGRSTASTGSFEEITVGSGLSLSGGSLSATGGGTGDVVGPASATDNAIARFDGTTGKLIQNSAATIADTSGNITAGTYNGNTIGAGSTSGTNTGDQTNISGNAATATTATNIASTNEATDTTCFPLFITASGSQTLNPKNNTGLTFNSNSVILGSTIFNAGTGYRIGNAAAAGVLLRGDGTNYIASGTTIPDTGTSGGILGYTASGVLASSAALAANKVVIGGGAGATPTTSGVDIDSSNNISLFGPSINVQTGTSYTLQASDTGKIVTCSNAAGITVTLPNSLNNFCCRVVQKGVGQVTFSPTGGATLNNRYSFTKTNGQWSEVDLYVDSNAGGSSAVYVMQGDGST